MTSLPGLGLIVRAAAADTSGRFSLIESVGQEPGGGPPSHRHEREDEAFFVLEGSYLWERGDEHTEAGPGDFIWLPRVVFHRFVVGSSGGRMLHMFMPGGLDRYFVEWQEALDRGSEGVVRQLAARYGLTYRDV